MGGVLGDCSDDDEGENRLLQDFGPGSSRARCGAPGRSGSSFDSLTRRLERYVTGENGLHHRIVYDPTELARLLQPRRPGTDDDQWQLIACLLEAALDPSRPRCESMLLCKAITDAYLVNRGVGVAADGGDDAGDLLAQTLRQAWQHAVAVGHWDGYIDEWRHRAVDLHLVASWFQAWEASDYSTGSQTVRGVSAKPAGTPPGYLPDVLPGDWVWVLDQLPDEGHGGAGGHDDKTMSKHSMEGLHLEEELELEANKEQVLGLSREKWALGDLKRSLLLVSDDHWFQEGMIDIRVLGPNRPSTFKKVFSDVPGAIYGCLKGLAGAALTPPTFRMYTTGDIVEALGADVVTSSPRARAQTANLPQSNRPQGVRDPRRSSTASGRGGRSRTGVIKTHPRQGIFLPHGRHEADKDSKFYTASTVCTLGRIFSDSSLIHPAWTKVATSPWGEAARVTGGYGERLLNGANSVESPDFMFSRKFGGHVKDYSFKKRSRPFAYNGEANTAVSDDTPKFFRGRHTQVYGRPIEKIEKPRLLKMQLGRQMIAEPEVPETDLLGGPLDWSDIEVTGSSVAARHKTSLARSTDL
eukprot:g5607.t1